MELLPLESPYGKKPVVPPFPPPVPFRFRIGIGLKFIVVILGILGLNDTISNTGISNSSGIETSIILD